MDNKTIYTNYVKDIYKYAYFNLKNREDAEDTTFETFTRFYEKNILIEHEKVKPYLIGIARNLFFEKYRQKLTYDLSVIDEVTQENNNKYDEYNLENVVIDEQLLEIIKRELNNLKAMEKDIIVLKIWEELKFNQIADIVSLNVNSVKTIYYKAIENLKNLINSNNIIKLKSISFPILLGSILAISKESVFNINTNYLNNLFITNLFFKNLFMNSSNALMVGKTGILATTSAKIIAITASLIVVTGAVAATVLITSKIANDNNKSQNSLISYPQNSSIFTTSSMSSSQDNKINLNSSANVNSSVNYACNNPNFLSKDRDVYYCSTAIATSSLINYNKCLAQRKANPTQVPLTSNDPINSITKYDFYNNNNLSSSITSYTLDSNCQARIYTFPFDLNLSLIANRLVVVDQISLTFSNPATDSLFTNYVLDLNNSKLSQFKGYVSGEDSKIKIGTFSNILVDNQNVIFPTVTSVMSSNPNGGEIEIYNLTQNQFIKSIDLKSDQSISKVPDSYKQKFPSNASDPTIFFESTILTYPVNAISKVNSNTFIVHFNISIDPRDALYSQFSDYIQNNSYQFTSN